VKLQIGGAGLPQSVANHDVAITCRRLQVVAGRLRSGSLFQRCLTKANPFMIALTELMAEHIALKESFGEL
jgi:hypothetical protein